ncbi:MAG: uroporphyrinogen-III C-methyltransferase, partial [Rhizobiales bacterium]|nr:uroporphyrinogen-III C-methyltransferase [Hyphomicrobiales bacterium]
GRSVAARIAARLTEAGLSAATPVSVIENATLPHRRIFAGALAELIGFAERGDVDGPALILIGAAAREGALALSEPLAEPLALARIMAA